MGLSWQQGPLAPGAIGRFLVPDPLPNTGQLNRCYHCYQFFLTLLPVRIISPLHRVARDRIQLKRSKAARSTGQTSCLENPRFFAHRANESRYRYQSFAAPRNYSRFEPRVVDRAVRTGFCVEALLVCDGVEAEAAAASGAGSWARRSFEAFRQFT
jgi:hypothetical protein